MNEDRDGRDELQKALDDIRDSVQRIQGEVSEIKKRVKGPNVSVVGLTVGMFFFSVGVAFLVAAIQLGVEHGSRYVFFVLAALPAFVLGYMALNEAANVGKKEKH